MSYYVPGARKIRGQRITLGDRVRMWRKRRERAKEMIWPWH